MSGGVKQWLHKIPVILTHTHTNRPEEKGRARAARGERADRERERRKEKRESRLIDTTGEVEFEPRARRAGRRA